MGPLLYFSFEDPRSLGLVEARDFEDLGEYKELEGVKTYTCQSTHLRRVQPAIGAPLHDRDTFAGHFIDRDARVGRFEDDVWGRQ